MNRQQRMNTSAFRQNLIWGSRGDRFNPIGYAKVFWLENGDVLRPVFGILALCFAYNWISIKLQRVTTVAFQTHLKEREELMQASGKVKSREHIVKPGRMTDDLDYGHIPSGVENPGGVGKYVSRQFAGEVDD